MNAENYSDMMSEEQLREQILLLLIRDTNASREITDREIDAAYASYREWCSADESPVGHLDPAWFAVWSVESQP